MSVFETQLPLSAFGDLRTVELTPLFQGSFEYTVDNTDLLEKFVSGSGAITQATGKAVLSTGTTAGSYAYLQTKTHARYRAGLGGLYRFTVQIDSDGTGTKHLAGLADKLGSTAAFNNGYCVGRDNDQYGFHRYQNDVRFTTPISSWDDPLDGTGPSGLTIDWTKLNVFFINYQYIGAGAQFIYYEDQDTGKVVLVHTAPYSNQNTVPSVYNPNFHGVLYVSNGATTTDYQISSASYAYFVEGRVKEFQIHQPQNTSDVVEVTGITAEVPLFSIRVKAQYASKDNYIDILLERIVASVEASAANNLAQIRVIKDPATLTGASWVDINTNNSVVELDTSATAFTGGNPIIVSPLAGKNDKTIENLVPYDIVGQESDVYTVTGLSANSATIRSALLWKELF